MNGIYNINDLKLRIYINIMNISCPNLNPNIIE